MPYEIKVVGMKNITDMTVDVFQPNGSEREFNIGPLTEHAGTHQSLYLGDCATIQAGDTVISSRGTTLWGGNEYKQLVSGVGAASAIAPAGYVGDYKGDEVVTFPWHTNVNLSSNGTIKVYRKDSNDEVTIPTGITDTRDFDNKTGAHRCSINLAANGYYTKERDYVAVLADAAVYGVPVNAIIATFSIKNRYQGREFEKEG